MQLRFEAAVAGVVPVIRVLRGVARRRATSTASTGSSTARRTSSSARWRATAASYEEALAEAQRLGYAEADPSDDVNGTDAAAKMAILARLAFGAPVHLDDVRYEGIEHDHGRRHRLRARARPVAEADRHRRAHRRTGSRCACTRRSCTARTRSPPSTGRSTRSRSSPTAITEITMSGPGAGGPQTASAVLGDVVSAMIPPAVDAATPSSGCRSSRTSRRRSTCTWRSTTGPACWPRSPSVLGMQGASIKSVVQQRARRERAAGHGRAPAPRVALLRRRSGLIGGLDFVRSRPRAIRVIDEEFGDAPCRA